MNYRCGIEKMIAYRLVLNFIPLESPRIYVGDVRSRKHQILIEGRVKALPFLTGFTLLYWGFDVSPPPIICISAK
jgi:hypothetical protein